MTKGAYYNEHDKFAAAWLRELIAWGLIADGDVDERSIEDVASDDLRGYTQCHFFAGIGVWSRALRQAGWDDDRSVWTGSCPCQPFSAAGKGGGFADERHLWPTWHWLIEQRRPGVVFGEQVASKPGLAWFDLVHADLEGSGYAVGAHDLCAAGVGAPHIRQRLFFVAHHHGCRPGEGRRDNGEVLGVQETQRQSELGSAVSGRSGGDGIVAVADGGDASAERLQRSREHGQQQEGGRSSGLVDAEGEQKGLPRRAREPGSAVAVAEGEQQHRTGNAGRRWGEPSDDSLVGDDDDARLAVGSVEDVERGTVREEGSAASPAGVLRGPWSDVEWIPCRDGKWRPTQPGLFPLVNGSPARVGRLRGYGNAIVLPVAQAFIEAAMICL